MNKSILSAIIATILLLSVPIFANAKRADTATKKDSLGFRRHELTLTYSRYPIAMIPIPPTNGESTTKREERNMYISDIYHSHHESTTTDYGSFYLDYTYNFKKWLGVTAMTGFNIESRTAFYPYNEDKKFTETDLALYIGVMARFTWYRNDWFKGYSSVGVVALPYSMGFSNKIDAITFFPHIDVLGMQFGKQLYGVVKLGIGLQYIGGNIGIGYSF